MGAAEIFRADGTYLRFDTDDTVLIARWANCDLCEKQFEKSLLTTHSELWLCATCASMLSDKPLLQKEYGLNGAFHRPRFLAFRALGEASVDDHRFAG